MSFHFTIVSDYSPHYPLYTYLHNTYIIHINRFNPSALMKYTACKLPCIDNSANVTLNRNEKLFTIYAASDEWIEMKKKEN